MFKAKFNDYLGILNVNYEYHQGKNNEKNMDDIVVIASVGGMLCPQQRYTLV